MQSEGKSKQRLGCGMSLLVEACTWPKAVGYVCHNDLAHGHRDGWALSAPVTLMSNAEVLVFPFKAGLGLTPSTSVSSTVLDMANAQ